VPDREAAAAQGITRFFADGGCFASAVVARVDPASRRLPCPAGSDLLLVLTVRELGPTVKLLSSAALVEGGTEVVVDVAVVPAGAARAGSRVLDSLAGRWPRRGERGADAAIRHGGGLEGGFADPPGPVAPPDATEGGLKRLFSRKDEQK
jgi:hypothetical protein